jgi:hypothetical protein
LPTASAACFKLYAMSERDVACVHYGVTPSGRFA